MANIEKTVREKVKNGNMCKCPCHSGIALDVAKVDVLLSAAYLKLAGYGIAAAWTGRRKSGRHVQRGDRKESAGQLLAR